LFVIDRFVIKLD